jgi:hypothetical protein
LADLVIDEWLWADLSGDNSDEAQKETFEFLQAIYNKCDRIVTVKGSKFYQKTFDLCKHTDVKHHKIVRFYKNKFLFNSKKSINLDQSSLKPVPDHISKAVKKNDHYLIQAYLTAEASVIVTTDIPLKTAVNNGINCQLRNEFVPSYISQYGRK